MDPTTDRSWWIYLISDTKVVGIVTWLSLFATLIGFWIAFRQLRKVKTASESAENAVKQTQHALRSHEQSSKISAAMEYISSADAQIQHENSDAAGAYLSIAWVVLIEAKELTVSPKDIEEIGEYVRQTKRLVDEIRAPSFSQVVSNQILQERHYAISQTLSGLGSLSARVKVNLAGVGGRPNE